MAEDAGDHTVWEQGDACLSVDALPVIVPDDGDAEFIEVRGVVVLTQTCDMIRELSQRPNFHVAALVPANSAEMEQIRQFGRPQYVYVPQCADMGLVGDLDLIASYSKSVLSGWSRLPAPAVAAARRDFGYATGRHRSRVAFPDRWAAELDKLRSWLRSKSQKSSPEGIFATSIEQMRIVANDTDCPEEAEIICLIPATITQTLRSEWAKVMIPKLESKIDESWGCKVIFRLATTTEITAAEYLNSFRLDFDALSRAA